VQCHDNLYPEADYQNNGGGKNNSYLLSRKKGNMSHHLVFWSLGTLTCLKVWVRGLIVQGEDESPLTHPTYGKLLCCVALSRVFLRYVSKVQEKSSSIRRSLSHEVKT
jgi:hypothetical protein